VGVAYNQTLQAIDGTPPYSWSLESGTLPAGLTLNTSTGVISGMPTAAGSSAFTVKATDSAALSDTQALSITVAAPPPPPPPTTPNPPLLDDFNRSSENPVSQGENWAQIGITGGAAARVSNQRLRYTTFGSYSYRVRPYFGGSLEAAVRIRTRPSSEEWVSVFVCLQDAGTPEWSGYELRAVSLSNTTDRWEIWRKDGSQGATKLAETFYEIPSGGWMLLRRTSLGLEFWTRTSSGSWTRRLQNETVLWDQRYMYGTIGTGLLRSGELDDFSGGSLLSLLDQYAPELHPSAFDVYRASSPAVMTDHYVSGVHSNTLFTPTVGILAQADPSLPEDDLTLSYLGEVYPDEGIAQGRLPTLDDYIDAADDPNPGEIQTLQSQPANANRAYARITSGPNGGQTLQYWLFYYFNFHPEITDEGDHEGDWEMVQFELDARGVPIRAAYSQHLAGERCDWENVEQTTTGRPIAYVARGSHASYFRQGHRMPKPWAPLGDEADGNGTPQIPSITQINDPPRWLSWPGRWGEGGAPPGPARQGDKWDSPAEEVETWNNCWEAGSGRIGGTARPVVPAPRVVASRVGKRVRIAYSFADWPDDASIRPVRLLTSVQSNGARYAPYPKEHRITERSDVVWQPLGLGKGPFKIFALAYSRDADSSRTVVTRIRGR
jgi:hypothetical protein